MTRAPRARDEVASGHGDAPSDEPLEDDVVEEDDDEAGDGDEDEDSAGFDEDEDDDGEAAVRGRGSRPARAATPPLEMSEQVALAARFGVLVVLPVAFWIAGSFAVGVIAFLVLAGVMAGTLAPDGPVTIR